MFSFFAFIINDKVSAWYMQFEPGVIVYGLMETDTSEQGAPVADPVPATVPASDRARVKNNLPALVDTGALVFTARALAGAIAMGAASGRRGGGRVRDICLQF